MDKFKHPQRSTKTERALKIISDKNSIHASVFYLNCVLIALLFGYHHIFDLVLVLSRRCRIDINETVFSALEPLNTRLAAAFVVLIFGAAYSWFYWRDHRTCAAGTEEKRTTLPASLGISYIGHVTLACIALALAALNPVNHDVSTEHTACEFLLQPGHEPNKDSSKYFSLRSSLDHGRHNPNREMNDRHASASGQGNRNNISNQPRRRTIYPQNRKLAESRTNQGSPTTGNQASSPRAVKQERRAADGITTGARLPADNARSIEKARQVNTNMLSQRYRTASGTRAPVLRPSTKRAVQPQRIASRPLHKPHQAARQRRDSADHGDGPVKAFNPQHNVDDEPGAYRTRRDINFGPYMMQLQRRIKRNWHPPSGSAKIVSVRFKIHPAGRISGLRITRSSGLGGYDRAALQAVHAASPFMPLPDGRTTAIDVHFDFEY